MKNIPAVSEAQRQKLEAEGHRYSEDAKTYAAM